MSNEEDEDTEHRRQDNGNDSVVKGAAVPRGTTCNYSSRKVAGNKSPVKWQHRLRLLRRRRRRPSHHHNCATDTHEHTHTHTNRQLDDSNASTYARGITLHRCTTTVNLALTHRTKHENLRPLKSSVVTVSCVTSSQYYQTTC